MPPMISADALFRPFPLKALELPNRIAMAPMTRKHSPGQVPGPDVAAYYRRRAEGGVGLIITEGTAPDHPSATNDAAIPAFFGEKSLAGWAAVLAAVCAAGGHIMPQLWHQGIARAAGTGPYPDAPSMSPSGIARPGGEMVAEAMTQSDIDAVVAGFAASAGHARRLGFDGVELHGAHGYLIDQFLWEGTNRREDGYGGSLEARTRLACEIVTAVRAAVGAGFPISFRFSQWKLQDYTARLVRDPSELERLLVPLARAGVDIFHASTRRFWEPEFPDHDAQLNLAGWAKRITGLPAMTVGSVSLNADFHTAFRQRGAGASEAHLEGLCTMLERGDVDMVAIGRALLANPDWPNKIRSGKFAEIAGYEPALLDTLV